MAISPRRKMAISVLTIIARLCSVPLTTFQGISANLEISFTRLYCIYIMYGVTSFSFRILLVTFFPLMFYFFPLMKLNKTNSNVSIIPEEQYRLVYGELNEGLFCLVLF